MPFRVFPGDVRADLDAGCSVHEDDQSVHERRGGRDLPLEVHVAGVVNEVDPVPAPVYMAELHGDAVFSGDLFVEVIGNGVALFDGAQPFRDAGVVEDMLQKHGLPDAAVPYNADITFFPRIYDRHDVSLRFALV